MEKIQNKIKYNIKIVDNFLNEKDYKELSNLEVFKDLKKEKDGIKVFHNEVNNNGVIKSVLSKDLILNIHKTYHYKAIEILKEICPEKVSLYEYSDFSFVVTDKNSKFPIHDDTPDKLLSGVIYLAPEENTGTIFYNDKNGQDKTVVGWKVNRAVFFSRKERETWHSYEGDKHNDRVALVYNLKTSKIKDVFEIEKKNYFLGNLRWRLNPRIYQYFKILI